MIWVWLAVAILVLIWLVRAFRVHHARQAARDRAELANWRSLRDLPDVQQQVRWTTRQNRGP